MKLTDRLYTETDDTCALCGFRDAQALTIHHIDGNHVNNAYGNTIILCHNCHTRYHQSKGITVEDIKARKRHLIYKTVTTYGVNALKNRCAEQIWSHRDAFSPISPGRSWLYE